MQKNYVQGKRILLPRRGQGGWSGFWNQKELKNENMGLWVGAVRMNSDAEKNTDRLSSGNSPPSLCK